MDPSKHNPEVEQSGPAQGRLIPLLEAFHLSGAIEKTVFTFTCGGTIPIQSPALDANSGPIPLPGASTHSAPVQLRWDPRDITTPASQTKLTFPLDPHTRENLQQLINDMQPATFGLGGVDVYDESYRKATKLDPERFSSTFNPYELGIVDTIAQTLLPTLRRGSTTGAVRAELYKLNVYSGPSGKFKSHVDTPRSPSQFGSLVVCLPLEHDGGALEVRHQGWTVTFDWSGKDPQSIGCAAFYSDCEHEVLEVTKGHRATLTYNLYCVRGNGQLGGSCPALDPSHLPMYDTIREIVFDKSWGENAYLGYYCSHSYPHTTNTALHFLPPDNLKGADMIVYEIFRSFGLKVAFRPALESPAYKAWEEWCMDQSDASDESGDVKGREHPARVAIGLSRRFQIWDENISDFHESQVEWNKWTGKQKRFQPRWHGIHHKLPMIRNMGYIDAKSVYWLNGPRGKNPEPQVSWQHYGNEAEPRMTYSMLTLIVKIPKGGAAHAPHLFDGEEEDMDKLWEKVNWIPGKGYVVETEG
ncbi:hypothetical protein QBC34DRAFT_321394 [Podospora aff. communis PSN243]|uniref:Fe2OG dioxygenase domain-containing protein n=1 Tax=Podospora aff. communis PSN243 TaxID=3040156 RepID=A0AAV9GZY5_9PEZI|nr:hypothetical protein QBC34DRAFT_321394 [Podospora aff. communis PSN243]